MYKVIKGTTNTVESELNKLSVDNDVSIKSTGVIGDLIVAILYIKEKPQEKKTEKSDSSKGTNKSKSTKDSGTKSTKSKS